MEFPLESNGIPLEFPLESSGNSSGITLFQWKKVPFIPLEFNWNSSRIPPEFQCPPEFQWNSTDSDFFHHFGNGTNTGSIGKNFVVFPSNWENWNL